jgi:hypothetical protein
MDHQVISSAGGFAFLTSIATVKSTASLSGMTEIMLTFAKLNSAAAGAGLLHSCCCCSPC